MLLDDVLAVMPIIVPHRNQSDARLARQPMLKLMNSGVFIKFIRMPITAVVFDAYLEIRQEDVDLKRHVEQVTTVAFGD